MSAEAFFVCSALHILDNHIFQESQGDVYCKHDVSLVGPHPLIYLFGAFVHDLRLRIFCSNRLADCHNEMPMYNELVAKLFALIDAKYRTHLMSMVCLSMDSRFV